MPTIRSRPSLTSRSSITSRKRTSGRTADLENALQVTGINTSPSGELKISPRLCQAPPCQHDFWWAPKMPKTKSARLRFEDEQQKPYMNVMYDPRVVRGPNFKPSLMDDFNPFDKASELRRQKALLKISQKYNCKSRNKRDVIGTVPPVHGRQHLEIQTDKYLEELVAAQQTTTVDTQTDLFLERPPIPPYKPAKVGIDAATEIGDGELFHFDAEAQPIIDVLVDGAIEHSILEVAHEQELSAIRAEQEKFLAKREAELAELRRLEAEEIRLQGEKERRMRQDCIARQLDAEMQRAVVAAKLLQGHVSSLLPEIWENLEPASDAAQKNYLLNSLCPWLCREIEKENKQILQSRQLLNGIIADIVKERAIIYGGAYEETGEPIMQEEAEAAEDAGGVCCCCCQEVCCCPSSSTLCGSLQKSSSSSSSSSDECIPHTKKIQIPKLDHECD